jgi:hypothetical protein
MRARIKLMPKCRLLNQKKNKIELLFCFLLTLTSYGQTTVDKIAKFTTTGGDVGNSIIYDNGKIGINTTSPAQMLDVNGVINTNNPLFMDGSPVLRIDFSGGLYNTAIGAGGPGGGLIGVSGGSSNTIVGNAAFVTNYTGSGNSMFGANTGNVITGDQNNGYGYNALYGQGTNASSHNCGFGSYSLQNIASANYNNAIGNYALNSNTYAGDNIAVGYQAMKLQSYSNSNTTWSSYNVAVGNSALYSNQPTSTSNGVNNDALGYQSLYNNTTGANNTSIGHNSGYYNQTGTDNAILGYEAGGYGAGAVNSFSNNCFFGSQAGYSNTTGSPNVAIGYQSLYTNATGNNNVATGYKALYANTNNNNNAYGYQALTANVGGSDNDAFGIDALSSNTSGTYNCAFGSYALETNSTGVNNSAYGGYALSAVTTNYNSAFGYEALGSLSSGDRSTAVGCFALTSVTTGTQNCAIGYEALQNTTGSANTGLGYAAGWSNTTGKNNTFVGYLAVGALNSYTNCAAIGNGASAGGNDQMRLGNVNATIYCQAGVFTGSDGRFKTNVAENVKGLAFINKLRPVTYNVDTKKWDDFYIQNLPDSMKALHRAGMDFVASTAKVHSGFIAQEVERAGIDANFVSSIVSEPSNSSDSYALNYSEMVVPLVKAVQELSHNADSLKTIVHRQDSINKILQSQINQIVEANSHANSSNGTNNALGSINIELSNVNAVVLNDAVPNPFAEQTTIGYNIPQNFNSAQILFYDNGGQLIKSVDIKAAGKGQLNVFANDLSNGTYSYTLIIDGKMIATKRIIKQQ